MTYYKWLTVSGGVLLVSGLLTAFISSHYTDRDFWFYVGLVLTATGVILQTLGAILPIKLLKINQYQIRPSGPVSLEPKKRMITLED